MEIFIKFKNPNFIDEDSTLCVTIFILLPTEDCFE
jgi:hypothetical protein